MRIRVLVVYRSTKSTSGPEIGILLEMEEEDGSFVSTQDCCNKTKVDDECIGLCEPSMCQFYSQQEGASFIGSSSCSTHEKAIKKCCLQGII